MRNVQKQNEWKIEKAKTEKSEENYFTYIWSWKQLYNLMTTERIIIIVLKQLVWGLYKWWILTNKRNQNPFN